MSTPEIERGHRRMDQIERMLDMMESNPAPTVPQYDLQGIDNSAGPPPSPGPRTDYWITCDIKFNSIVIASQAADPGNDFFAICSDQGLTNDPSSLSFGPAARLGTDPTVLWETAGPHFYDSNYQGVVAADIWYTVEIHVFYDVPNLEWSPELFVNGTNMELATGQTLESFDVTGDSYVYFGTDVTDGEDGYVTQFRNIKIGTIRGSNNLFDGSSLSNTVVPPFDGTIHTGTHASINASGGILEADADFGGFPQSEYYAYVNISD